MRDHGAQQILQQLLLVLTASTLLLCQLHSVLPQSLLCGQCGLTILNSNASLLRVTSPLALYKRNATGVLGASWPILVQRFRNPEMAEFDLVTLEHSAKLRAEVVGDAYMKDTWFPGFSWQVLLCSRCHFHLGWLFRSASDNATFLGIVLDHVMPSAPAVTVAFPGKGHAEEL